MDSSRSAGINAYLPAYLDKQLREYAHQENKSVSEIVETWIVDAIDFAQLEMWAGRFHLPYVGPGLVRLAIFVAPEVRDKLNDAAREIGVILGKETVSARRLLRWLVENRLQALGKL